MLLRLLNFEIRQAERLHRQTVGELFDSNRPLVMFDPGDQNGAVLSYCTVGISDGSLYFFLWVLQRHQDQVFSLKCNN